MEIVDVRCERYRKGREGEGEGVWVSKNLACGKDDKTGDQKSLHFFIRCQGSAVILCSLTLRRFVLPASSTAAGSQTPHSTAQCGVTNGQSKIE